MRQAKTSLRRRRCDWISLPVHELGFGVIPEQETAHTIVAVYAAHWIVGRHRHTRAQRHGQKKQQREPSHLRVSTARVELALLSAKPPSSESKRGKGESERSMTFGSRSSAPHFSPLFRFLWRQNLIRCARPTRVLVRVRVRVAPAMLGPNSGTLLPDGCQSSNKGFLLASVAERCRCVMAEWYADNLRSPQFHTILVDLGFGHLIILAVTALALDLEDNLHRHHFPLRRESSDATHFPSLRV